MMLKSFNRDTKILILHRDEQLIAVYKPAGMVVHPTDLARDENISVMLLVRRIMRRKVWPVHRLDRPTSGIVLFALNRDSASELGRLFQARQAYKKYLAVVRGIPADREIDYPLKEQPLFRSDLTRAVPQQAITGLRLLDRAEIAVAVGRYPTSRYALVELTPTTGRRHQLRRHMKHICHPIIGDTTYGDGVHNRFFRAAYDCDRLLLTATGLSFIHPATGEALSIMAPPDADFRSALEHLGMMMPALY